MDIFGSSNRLSPRLIPVTNVEGQPILGSVLKEFLLDGDHMTMMQVHFRKGGSTPRHTHDHESMIFVLQGRIQVVVGDRTEVLTEGGFCLHPANVTHTVLGLEDSVVIEVKSPSVSVDRLSC